MAVYVDNARSRYGRMLMSHMVADTLTELHSMAAAIGVARRWFQWPATVPHYDICQSKRALAVRFGAQQVSAREIVKMKPRLERPT